MKSLIYKALGVLEMGETPYPETPVVLKVTGTGICGTDLKTVYKGHRFFTPPTVLGHEFYGQIEKAPEGYKYPVGTWVTVAPYFECGECDWCKNGLGDFCENKRYVETGSFAEYVGIPEGYEAGIFPLPEMENKEDYDVFALTEPLSCVLNGLSRLNIKQGYSKVLIVGGGPMGVLFAFCLQKLNIDFSVVEPSEARASVLRQWNINTVKPEEVGKGEYDNVVLAVNIGALVEQYLPLVRKGGSLLVFAGLPKGDMLNVDAGAIHYNEINVTGCSGFSLHHFEEAFRMISEAPDLFRRLISCKMNLSEGMKAFEMLKAGQAFKIILGSEF